MLEEDNAQMLILVTDGLGAVGSYLVRELRQRRRRLDQRPPAPLGSKYLRGDVGNYRQLEHVVTHKKFDVVYHLAAEFGRWNGRTSTTRCGPRTSSAPRTCSVFKKHRFRQIFFSSSEVYGDYEGTMSEDVMDRVEIKQMNDYALSKWVGEQQILNSTAMHGTESVRVRLFNTYGPGEPYSSYRSVICRFVYCALNDLPYNVYLNHTRTSTYITDMCTTLANICERFKAGEVYNIAGTDYHDIKTASDLILKASPARPTSSSRTPRASRSRRSTRRSTARRPCASSRTRRR